MIKQMIGDILTSDAGIICHQVNCQGAFGSGMAGHIKDKYPEVCKEYKEYTQTMLSRFIKENLKSDILLGHTMYSVIGDGKYIAHLYGQNFYGRDGKLYTDYPALAKTFVSVKNRAAIGKITTIAFPYGMGCNNAGGDWKIVSDMIKTAFSDFDGTVEIWRLEG